MSCAASEIIIRDGLKRLEKAISNYNKAIAKGIIKVVLQIAGIAIICWLVSKLQSLFTYLGVAAVLTLMGRPLNKFLNKKLKLNTALATSITLLVLLATLSGIISLFVPLLTQQSENLSLLDVSALERD